MTRNEILRLLKENGMRVTPQRFAVLEAVIKLANHPEAEQITEFVRRKNSNISLATVYKILEAFTACGIIKVLRTDSDSRRYDAVQENHHHIYHTDSGLIEDYTDRQINKILNDYFERNPVKGLLVEDIKLQIFVKSPDRKTNVKSKNKKV